MVDRACVNRRGTVAFYSAAGITAGQFGAGCSATLGGTTPRSRHGLNSSRRQFGRRCRALDRQRSAYGSYGDRPDHASRGPDGTAGAARHGPATAQTMRLVEGYVDVRSLGPVPVKGLTDPIEVF